jgi:hypothetical protein
LQESARDKKAEEKAKAEDMEGVERAFREDATGQEEAAALVRGAERERIPRAIMGKGEILSEELKEFLKEDEDCMP